MQAVCVCVCVCRLRYAEAERTIDMLFALKDFRVLPSRFGTLQLNRVLSRWKTSAVRLFVHNEVILPDQPCLYQPPAPRVAVTR
jgi:hypothetical protein